MTQYVSTGTIAVTKGSKIVNGTLTPFEASLVAEGCDIDIDTGTANVRMSIASVQSDTKLTTTLPWRGSDASGLSYSIRLAGDVQKQTALNTSKIAALLDNIAAISEANIDITGGRITGISEFVMETIAAYAMLVDTDGALGGSMSAGLRMYAGPDEHGQVGFFGTTSGLMLVRNLQGDLYIEADARNLKSGSQILLKVDSTTLATVSPDGFQARNMFSGDVTIADDAAATISLPNKSGFVFIHTDPKGTFPQGQFAGIAIFDIGNTTAVSLAYGGADFATSNSDLTGTTGTDGKLTVGAATGSLKIENRSGASRPFRYTILG